MACPRQPRHACGAFIHSCIHVAQVDQCVQVPAAHKRPAAGQVTLDVAAMATADSMHVSTWVSTVSHACHTRGGANQEQCVRHSLTVHDTDGTKTCDTKAGVVCWYAVDSVLRPSMYTAVVGKRSLCTDRRTHPCRSSTHTIPWRLDHLVPQLRGRRGRCCRVHRDSCTCLGCRCASGP